MLKTVRNIVLLIPGVILLSMLGIYLLSLGKHDKITRLLEEGLYEATGATMEVGDVRLTYLSNFPYLTMELDSVVLHSPDFRREGRELVRASLLAIQLRPLSLLRSVPRIRSILLEDGKIMLFRDPAGKMNILSQKGGREETVEGPREHRDLLSIDLISVRNFSFQYLDSLRLKDLHVTFTDTRIELDGARDVPRAEIVGSWYFDGLTFKMAKGGYLEKKEVLVDLGMDLQLDSSRLVFLPSTIEIEGNPFGLDGKLELTKPAFLALNLQTEGIAYDDLLPLLTPALQTSLAKFNYDGRVQGDFHLAGALLPGRPAPITFNAAGQGGQLVMKTFSIDSLNFEAAFNSHCDTSRGPGAPIDCLEFTTATGLLLERVPFEAKVDLFDLKNPLATVDAELEVDLTEIDPLLPNTLQLDRGTMSARIFHKARMSAYGPGKIKPDSIQLSGEVHLQDAHLRNPLSGTRLSSIQSDIRLENNNLLIDRFALAVNGDYFRLGGTVEGFLPALLDSSRQVEARLRVYTPELDMENFLGTGEDKLQTPVRQAKGARWNGLANVVDNILARGEASLDVYAGKLIYGRFSANQVSFNSRLREFCPGGTERCLELNRLRARIYDIIPLEADMVIRNPNDPQLDLRAGLSVQAEELNKMLPPDQIQFAGGSSAIDISYQGSMNDFLDTQEFGLIAEVDGSLHIDSVSFELGGGNYRVDSVQAWLEFDERNLSMQQLDGQINGMPIQANGQFTGLIPFFFLPERPVGASLGIQANYIDFEELPFIAAPPPQAESVRDSVELNTGVTQILDSLLVYLQLQLKVKADSLRYHNFFAERVGFTTTYQSDCLIPLGASDGCLEVSEFQAFLMKAIPLEADFKVYQLQDPVFQFAGNVDLPLENLNELFPPEQLRFQKGRLMVDFNYSGQPHKHYDQENLVLNAELEGTARLHDATFEYVSKGYRFDSAHVDLRFNQSDLYIDTLDILINENALSIHGEIDSLVPFILSPDRSLYAYLTFNSPRFTLDHFSAPSKREHLSSANSGSTSQLKTLLDTTLSQIRAIIDLRVDTVNYRKFTSTGLNGGLIMTSDKVQLDSLNMQLADGSFFLQGEISGLEKNAPHIDLRTSLKQVNVQEVFESFDNFGQAGLTHENISGILDADVTFQADANNNYDLDPSSFSGQATITISQGGLENLPLFKDMNSILFRGRHLENIEFAQLQNTFHLDGQHFHVDYFNIYSSAFTFGLQGRYCFDDPEHTNMLITVPLSNLFRRYSTVEKLESYQAEDKIGLSVYLRLRGKNEKLKLFPTLFPNRVLEQE